jgi:hypothetical protein
VFIVARYPLKNLLILDYGSTLYIFNEITHFINYQPTIHRDFVWAGDHKVAILGYGEVNIEIQGLRDKEVFCLVKVTVTNPQSTERREPIERKQWELSRSVREEQEF